MSEFSSSPERRGKFASARDQILYELSLNGWANEYSGQVDASSGWFARMSNGQAELDDLQDALAVPFDSYGLADPNDLVGHWLIQEDNVGFVDVTGYPDEQQLEQAYEDWEAVYALWQRGNL